jgi:hypothetical protein
MVLIVKLKALRSFHVQESQPDSQDIKSLVHFNLKLACMLSTSEDILFVDHGLRESQFRSGINKCVIDSDDSRHISTSTIVQGKKRLVCSYI